MFNPEKQFESNSQLIIDEIKELIHKINHCTPDQHDLETTPEDKAKMVLELAELNKKYSEYKIQNAKLVAQAEKEYNEAL